jgi:hypothetical protein
MKFAGMLCLFVLFAAVTTLAQTNPVPLVNQPLVPTAIAPGSAGFTLTVNGTGFVSGSVVNWNGTALSTTLVSSSQLTATVPASDIVTASTASITVSSPSPGVATSNVQFLSVSGPTNLQFTSFPLAAPGGYWPPVVADFNRDGKLDIFEVENQEDFQWSDFSLLGNGDGSFRLPDPYGESIGFESINIGDFTGDGILDVVGFACIPDEQTCYLDILLGNGDGTFSLGAYSYTFAAGGMDAPLVGDFNGDGKLDLAVAYDAGIYVLLGNGDGTFQNPLISNVGTVAPVGGVGDYNGDGKLDIAGVVGSGTANAQVEVFLGNGNGTFQTPTGGSTVDPSTNSLYAADLNGDNKLDLITLQGSAAVPTNTYTVLLGKGDGTFQAGMVHPTSVTPAQATLADINADGKLDLVLTANDGTSSTFLLLGNGDGTFQSATTLPGGPNNVSATGDFNDDGKMDLALAAAVLLQDVPQAVFFPTSVTFQGQLVGTTSAPLSVTLINSGTVALTISGIDISGANASSFSQANNCPASLAVNSSCQFSITFAPTMGNDDTLSASLVVTDNGPGSPQTVPLTGQGQSPPPVPSLSPASVTFPGQYVGTSSPPQTVVLNNPTGGPLMITSVTATPADFTALSTCGNALAAGATCAIGVFFDPTAGGARTGTLTVTDSGSNSPQTATLTGAGEDFSLAAGSQTSATVTPGQTATYMISVAPGGGFKQTVTLSCSGAPAQATCSVSPSSIALGSSASTVTVTVITAGRSAALTRPFGRPPYGGATVWLARSGTVCVILGLAISMSFAGWRRERRQGLLYGLAFLCLLSIGATLSACGGGRSSSGGGGTQPGTYNLTVTGTFTSGSTALTHNIKLTMVVQ